jgi:hypothetical protein
LSKYLFIVLLLYRLQIKWEIKKKIILKYFLEIREYKFKTSIINKNNIKTARNDKYFLRIGEHNFKPKN